jgi:hypothetical protein
MKAISSKNYFAGHANSIYAKETMAGGILKIRRCSFELRRLLKGGKW